MKLSPYRRRKNGIAFTLIELLVVIAIIAILAGVVIGSVSSALKFAKRTKANSMAAQIQTAMQAYYAEYGFYPVSGTVGGDDYYDGTSAGGTKWANLTIALCGNIDPYTAATTTSTVPNSRSIPYLSPSRSDLDSTNHTMKNPFGTTVSGPYFFMAVDTDYSGVVGDSAPAAGLLVDFSGTNTALLTHGISQGVAVWCSCDQALAGATGSRSAFWAHTY